MLLNIPGNDSLNTFGLFLRAMTLIYCLALLSSIPFVVEYFNNFNAPYFLPLSADFTIPGHTLVISVLSIMAMGLWFSWYG